MMKIKRIWSSAVNYIKRTPKRIALWSVPKKAIAGVCVVAVTATAVGGVFVLNRPTKEEPKKVAKAKKEKVVESTANKKEITVPNFAACAISGDSIEKDLTLYLTDAAGNKITGVSYTVKLLSKDQAKQLATALAAIDVDNSAIATATNDGTGAKAYDETTYNMVLDNAKASASASVKKSASGATDTAASNSTKSDVATSADDTDDSNKASSDEAEAVDKTNTEEKAKETSKELEKLVKPDGSDATISDALLVQKQNDVAAYATALSSVKAMAELTDDDKDGMIYAQKLTAGDFVACFVPASVTAADSTVTAYDASDYAVNVTVKEKIEYKPVKNIKKKIVKDAGDTQKNHAVAQEATFQDDYSSRDAETVKTESAKKASANNLVRSSLGEIVTKTQSYTVPATPTQTSMRSMRRVMTADTGTSRTLTIKYPGSVNYVTGTGDYKVEGISVHSSESSDDSKIKINGSAATSISPVVNDSTEPSLTFSVTDPSNVTVKYTIEVKKTSGETRLKSDDGNELYLDQGLTKPATISNASSTTPLYEKTVTVTYKNGWHTENGKTYYYDANGNKLTNVTKRIGGISYTFGSDGQLMPTGTGIDVSKWQGNIDWATTSNAVSFAIIRCGYRGSSGGIAMDPKFLQNMKGAKAHGVRVGVYFYSKATNEAMAVEEASAALSFVQQAGGGLTLPIYFDMEDACQKGLSKEENTAIANAFCATVAAGGHSAGVYASKSWFDNRMNAGSIGGNYSIWVARYNTYLGYSGRYNMWQYSSKGSIPGISGNVDLNIAY
ncbi:MAG: hypothetical protein II044_04655 [Lachnospiraceae bacterium]|nr:hypothetical protein [Lachnospiraceae bacterium]